MASLNKVILIGNLTADPELKQTPSGVSVTSFSIAVGRRFAAKESGTPMVDFITVVAWRQTAEFICRYFSKGRPILIVGALQQRSWTANDGSKRYATEVVADEAGFVDSKSDGERAQGGSPSQQGTYVPDAYNTESASFEDSDDENLPF